MRRRKTHYKIEPWLMSGFYFFNTVDGFKGNETIEL